jgi:hypothetical protein
MNTKLAYKMIELAALEFTAGRKWDAVCAKYRILGNMVSSQWHIEFYGAIDKKGDVPNREACHKATTAVDYIHDKILRTTGRRIWGLTFTLYPDGKYDIQYDYKKPEDYSDEVMTSDEVNASLNSLLNAKKGGI